MVIVIVECDRPAFTHKKFIHRRPTSKIVSYDMGNTSANFNAKISLVGLERCQIRHQALEAARVASNRYMMKNVGRSNYHLRIRVKPYHFLRENKMITGAGAYRVQDGMRLTFGKIIGRAARIKSQQPIISIRCNNQFIRKARTALKRAAPKLPTSCKIISNKIDSNTSSNSLF